MKEKLKDRYFLLCVFFIFFTAVIVFQLVKLQIVNGNKYYEDSRYTALKERKVVAPRGKITDRNMVPIAVNRQGFTVHIVKTDISNDEFNEMLLNLVNIFEKNGDSYNNSLSKYLTFNPITFNGQSEKSIRNWQVSKLGIKDTEVMESPREVFEYMKDKKFKIDEKYTDEEAYKIMTIRYEILLDQWRFDTGNSLCIAKDVSRETVAEVEEKGHMLPGISTDIEPVRQYIDAYYVAHVLGYVRPITEEQYEKWKDEGYSRNDIVGQTGIELEAERYLRGKDGHKRIDVNNGVVLSEGLNGVPAIPGYDVVLTIDMNLQKVATESLERTINEIRQKGGNKNFGDANAGSVVAIDVNTGEILVMANYPTYDPAVYLEGPDNKEAQQIIKALNTDSNSPQLNRAIQGKYAPGSTFKPLIAIAGLEEGVISPTNNIINCGGSFDVDGKIFRCLEYPVSGHGNLTLTRALETSCNIYFHKLGISTTIDKIEKWARYFGLGDYTGIDLGGESKGIIASKEYKMATFNDVWRPADTAQSAIGQLYNNYTPLQLANYISTLANGGKRFKPHIIKKVLKHDGSIVIEKEPEYEQIPVKPETIAAVKAGMVAVTTSIDGTAKDVFKDFPFEVAGKTGTAETGREATQSSNALFVCYAPADNPQIAVAVVIEKGVWGSYTAPVARDILAEYFGLNKKTGFDDKVVTDDVIFTR
ncbi:MAG TPA: penicillin-binding protein 2 [Clostridiaceae bacterium]|nr:penicillin-binding protein 2 [Clostridiaceae bacterium]